MVNGHLDVKLEDDNGKRRRDERKQEEKAIYIYIYI